MISNIPQNFTFRAAIINPIFDYEKKKNTYWTIKNAEIFRVLTDLQYENFLIFLFFKTILDNIAIKTN